MYLMAWTVTSPDKPSGQDGRTSSSSAATDPGIHAGKRLKTSPSNLVVTSILASPAGFYLVEHTDRHLTERGCPNMFGYEHRVGRSLTKPVLPIPD